MEKVEITIYNIDELKEKAKKHAIDKIRDVLRTIDQSSEDLKEYFTQELTERGYPVENINWSLGYCQGDGMAFYGTIPDLQKLAVRLGFTMEEGTILADSASLKIIKSWFGNHYSHWKTMELNCDDLPDATFDSDLFERFSEALEKDIRKTSQELEAKGYEIIESNESDESCISFAEANEYKFLSTGEIWRH